MSRTMSHRISRRMGARRRPDRLASAPGSPGEPPAAGRQTAQSPKAQSKVVGQKEGPQPREMARARRLDLRLTVVDARRPVRVPRAPPGGERVLVEAVVAAGPTIVAEPPDSAIISRYMTVGADAVGRRRPLDDRPPLAVAGASAVLATDGRASSGLVSAASCSDARLGALEELAASRRRTSAAARRRTARSATSRSAVVSSAARASERSFELTLALTQSTKVVGLARTQPLQQLELVHEVAEARDAEEHVDRRRRRLLVERTGVLGEQLRAPGRPGGAHRAPRGGSRSRTHARLRAPASPERSAPRPRRCARRAQLPPSASARAF